MMMDDVTGEDNIVVIYRIAENKLTVAVRLITVEKKDSGRTSR